MTRCSSIAPALGRTFGGRAGQGRFSITTPLHPPGQSQTTGASPDGSIYGKSMQAQRLQSRLTDWARKVRIEDLKPVSGQRATQRTTQSILPGATIQLTDVSITHQQPVLIPLGVRLCGGDGDGSSDRPSRCHRQSGRWRRRVMVGHCRLVRLRQRRLP